jgi:hypothetical protein
MQPIVGRIL